VDDDHWLSERDALLYYDPSRAADGRGSAPGVGEGAAADRASRRDLDSTADSRAASVDESTAALCRDSRPRASSRSSSTA